MSLADLRVFLWQFIRRHGRLIGAALGALAAGLLLGALAFAAFQIVPVYFKNYAFENAARKETQLAAANLRSDNAIRDDIYQKAQALGLPVEIGNIKVQSRVREDGPTSIESVLFPSDKPNLVGNVDIDVSYTFPVEFPGWTFRLNFRFHVDDRHI